MIIDFILLVNVYFCVLLAQVKQVLKRLFLCTLSIYYSSIIVHCNNCERDTATATQDNFTVWKNKKEVETGEGIKETADSTRSQFYTMFGWEGSNHDWNRSLKEVAQIVRAYVKEPFNTKKA